MLSVIAVILLTGCSQPVMDTSSDAMMEKSYGKVQDALPEEKRQAFAEAYATLVTSPDLVERVTGKNLKDALHGMTGEEVLSLANRTDVYQKQGERRRASLAEAKELERTGQYPDALAKYKDANAAGADEAEVLERIADLEAMIAGMEYVKQLDVTVEKLQAMSNGSLGLRYSITNNSDRVVTRVRVRIVFCDADKAVLAEEIYDPVAAPDSIRSTKTWEMPTNQYWSPTVRVPDGWTQENVQVKIIGLIVAAE
jgi:hypothetical protein